MSDGITTVLFEEVKYDEKVFYCQWCGKEKLPPVFKAIHNRLKIFFVCEDCKILINKTYNSDNS